MQLLQSPTHVKFPASAHIFKKIMCRFDTKLLLFNTLILDFDHVYWQEGENQHIMELINVHNKKRQT
jgi:hypothetical protein